VEYLPDKAGVTSVLGQKAFSPYAGREFPTRVLWGDTHLHTAVSVDAGTMCRLGQEDAFRFARGEEVVTTHGLRARLSRPLDFLVVSDHAEMYGLMPQLLKGDPEILPNEKGRRWYDMLQAGDADQAFAAAMEIVASLSKKEPPIKSDKAVRNAWRAYTALADKYNEPGRFTALIGYEWTARGKLFRQALRSRARSAPLGTCRNRGTRSESERLWLAAGGEWLCGGMGHCQHARSGLRRHETQRDLCHHRFAHDRPVLWWLGIR